MKIRDLEQWPPSVWSSAKLPNYSTAILTGVRREGKHLKLSVEDQGQEINTAIGPFEDDHLARRVALTLKDAVAKTIQDAGELVVKEIRFIDVKK